MKFSDILKRKEGDAPAARAAPVSPVPAVLSAPAKPEAAIQDEPDDVVEKRVAAAAIKAAEVYSEAISAARGIYLAAPEKASRPLPKETLFKLIALLQSGNQELLALADRSVPDNYLYGHVVNVAIFSVRLGISLNLSHDDLYALALGALLHDMGMVAYMSLALKPGRLSDQELLQVQRHAAEGQNLLSLFPTLTGALRDAVHQIVGQTHERAEGKGYPEHRAADATHPFAKIVGVCDVYESLTHRRVWRPRTLPHNALRLMIEEHESAFDPGMVKTLIEALSLYPPGSFVKLSSGDIGRVIFTNPGLPTRPKVKILIDARGNRVPGPKVVNLAAQPILYIADAVDETKIRTADHRLLLELRAQRWWVKGL